MTRKYDLERMLTEIREDELINRNKHEQLTQAEIRRLFAELRSSGRPAPPPPRGEGSGADDKGEGT